MRTHFLVKPSQAAVLSLNVMSCKDADCDADRTVEELLTAIDDNKGWVPKAILESALFCCNINDEDNAFAHPKEETFTRFLFKLLPDDYQFDRYYHQLVPKK